MKRIIYLLISLLLINILNINVLNASDHSIYFDPTHKSNLIFEDIDNKKYKMTDIKEDYIVVLFGKTNNDNTNNLINNIEKINDYKIKIIIALVEENKNEDLNDYQKKHPNMIIDVLYKDNKELMDILIKRYENKEETDLPVVLIINNEDDLLYYDSGKINDINEVFNKLDKEYKKKKEEENILVKYDIKGMIDYDKAYEALEILNLRRKENGLNELIMDKDLMEAAFKRAAEITFNLSHTRPNDKPMTSIHSKVIQENIAWGFDDAGSMMAYLMESPPHRGNILKEEWKSVGIGVYINNGKYYWSELFSTVEAKEFKKKSGTEEKIYNIETKNKYASPSLEKANYKIKGNEVVVLDTMLKTSATEIYDILNTSYTFDIKDKSIINIDENGNIKGINKGKTELIIYNKNDKRIYLKTNIEVTSDSDESYKCRLENGNKKDLLWDEENNKNYWCEKGVRQGTYSDPKCVMGDNTCRGREIYDPVSDGWYWLDSIYDGAKAINKEVWMPYIFQDEEPGSTEGKWVRYDNTGKMIKGWYTISSDLDKELYPNQIGNTYYYDLITGEMYKGTRIIDNNTYYFDEISGILKK